MILKKKYELLSACTSKKSLLYSTFLINYHYDHETMFCLLKKTLAALTFVKKKFDRTKLVKFIGKLRKGDSFQEKYDFEDSNTDLTKTKMVDKDGFLQIDEDLIQKLFEYEITKSVSNEIDVEWMFFLSCSKYYEFRLNKCDLLVDRRLFDLCLAAKERQEEFAVIVLHYIFQDFQDLNCFKEFIVHNDINYNTTSEEINVNYYTSVIYRIQNILKLKNVSLLENQSSTLMDKNGFSKDNAFKYLMKKSLIDTKFLNILSEMAFSYPRYLSYVDINYFSNLMGCYLDVKGDFFINESKLKRAKIALEFFAVCIQTRNMDFVENFTIFVQDILKRGIKEEIMKVVFILCYATNSINIDRSEMEEEEEILKSFFNLTFFPFLDNRTLEIFISVITKLEFPAFENLSNNRKAFFEYIGINGMNLKMIQDHKKYKDRSYFSVEEFSAYEKNVFAPKDLLGLSFNICYSFIYNSFKKEFEKNGFQNVKLPYEIPEPSSEESSNSTTSTNLSKGSKFVSRVNFVPREFPGLTISSVFSRLRREYDFVDEDLDSLFHEEIVSKVKLLKPKRTEEEIDSGDEYFTDDEYSDKIYVGIENGWVPDVSIKYLTRLTYVELKNFLIDLTDKRKIENLEYKPIDNNFLKTCCPRVREIFEHHEKLLKMYYEAKADLIVVGKDKIKPRSEINDFISEEVLYELIDAFFEERLTCDSQFYNFLRILNLFEPLRNVIFKKALFNFTISTDRYILTFEKDKVVAKSLEIIRLMITQFKIKEFDGENRVAFSRCLFKLLATRKFFKRALYLLHELEFTREIFDSTFKFSKSNFYQLEILKNNENFKSEITYNIIKISESLNSEVDMYYLKIIFKKMLNLSIFTPIRATLASLDFCLSSIFDESRIFSEKLFLGKKNEFKNKGLLLRSCFKHFFEQSRDKHEKEISAVLKDNGLKNENIEDFDFKYLYNMKFAHIFFKEDDFYSEIMTEELFYSLHNIITDKLEPIITGLINQKSKNISYELYTLYFSIISSYEGVHNILKVCGTKNIDKEKVIELQKKYLELRKRIGYFLETNAESINSLFIDESASFFESIKFLFRFNVINFTNKMKYLEAKIINMQMFENDDYVMNIRRDNILSDSFDFVMLMNGENFKEKSVYINFVDEEGKDCGGLTREWLSLVFREITTPVLGLFVYNSEKKTSFLPTKICDLKPDQLIFYRFVGRIMAIAILNRVVVDFHIDRSVFKYFLGKKCDLSDLEALDPQFHNSLVWIRDNQIDNVVNLTFSVEFEGSEVVDLKPNGRSIMVTDQNKYEYIDLMSEYKLFKSIEKQLCLMKEGLLEIVDIGLLSIFNENELELLLTGIPIIDLDDWKNNTIYEGYTRDSQIIKWFWKAVRSFTPEEKAKLLQFCTGSSRLPFGGFSQLQGNNGIQLFSISKLYTDDLRLPSAHTCFNQLELPEYPTFNDLRKSILYAINECSEGFGFI